MPSNNDTAVLAPLAVYPPPPLPTMEELDFTSPMFIELICLLILIAIYAGTLEVMVPRVLDMVSTKTRSAIILVSAVIPLGYSASVFSRHFYPFLTTGDYLIILSCTLIMIISWGIYTVGFYTFVTGRPDPRTARPGMWGNRPIKAAAKVDAVDEVPTTAVNKIDMKTSTSVQDTLQPTSKSPVVVRESEEYLRTAELRAVLERMHEVEKRFMEDLAEILERTESSTSVTGGPPTISTSRSPSGLTPGPHRASGLLSHASPFRRPGSSHI